MSFIHIVEDGECLVSIAERFGMSPDSIWNAVENTELRRLRVNAATLLPGDSIYIPEQRIKHCSVTTGSCHVFKRIGIPARFHLQLQENGLPRVGISYRLTVSDISHTVSDISHTGTTDADGSLHAWIPANARVGILEVEDGEIYELEFGRLQPVTSMDGIRARLYNLGYLFVFRCNNLEFEEAIKRFQSAENLPISGAGDEATFVRLVAAHRS